MSVRPDCQLAAGRRPTPRALDLSLRPRGRPAPRARAPARRARSARARRDAAGALWFAPAQLAAVARIQRLRAGLRPQLRRRRRSCSTCSTASTELEAALRPATDARPHPRMGGRSWT